MASKTSPADRILLTTGGVAAFLFCGISTYEILTRPGFDIKRHAISMLTLGDRGWVMTGTFIVSGLLTLLCALGLKRVLSARRWLPILVAINGLGLVLAGIFRAPAAMGFPPGTPKDQLPVITPGAIAHTIASLLAFASTTIACFVAARVSAGGWPILSRSAGVAMPLLVVLGLANVIAPGIAFFIAGIIGWVWLTLLVIRVADPSSTAAPSTVPTASLGRVQGQADVI
jgi:hypothetical protein